MQTLLLCKGHVISCASSYQRFSPRTYDVGMKVKCNICCKQKAAYSSCPQVKAVTHSPSTHAPIQMNLGVLSVVGIAVVCCLINYAARSLATQGCCQDVSGLTLHSSQHVELCGTKPGSDPMKCARFTSQEKVHKRCVWHTYFVLCMWLEV